MKFHNNYKAVCKYVLDLQITSILFSTPLIEFEFFLFAVP